LAYTPAYTPSLAFFFFEATLRSVQCDTLTALPSNTEARFRHDRHRSWRRGRPVL